MTQKVLLIIIVEEPFEVLYFQGPVTTLKAGELKALNGKYWSKENNPWFLNEVLGGKTPSRKEFWSIVEHALHMTAIDNPGGSYDLVSTFYYDGDFEHG